jgi:hypothetical protein
MTFALTLAQLEDPGSLVIIGATAGSLNAQGAFQRADNLFDKDADTIDVDSQHISAVAYAMRLAKVLHPPEVCESIEDFYEQKGLPNLTPDFPHRESDRGSIEIPYRDGSIVLTNAKYGPGSAIFTHQYSR